MTCHVVLSKTHKKQTDSVNSTHENSRKVTFQHFRLDANSAYQ